MLEKLQLFAENRRSQDFCNEWHRHSIILGYRVIKEGRAKPLYSKILIFFSSENGIFQCILMHNACNSSIFKSTSSGKLLDILGLHLYLPVTPVSLNLVLTPEAALLSAQYIN